MSTRIGKMGELKEGSYVVIDGEPCKVMSVAHSKPGKHGSAKVRIDAIGIFDKQKRSLVQPVDAKIEIPIIDKRSAQVISIMGDIVQLMDLETYETFELPIPDDFEGELENGCEVEYWKSLGKMKLVRRR